MADKIPARKITRIPPPKPIIAKAVETLTTPKRVITKVKKTYAKPGQKYDSPVKTDPLYRFYMSLHKQNPKSQMAIKWCLERGLFTERKATSLLLSLEMEKKAKL